MRKPKLFHGLVQGSILIGMMMLALLLRVFHLEADPPWDLSWSQGVLTDPIWYTDTAISWIKGIPATVGETGFHQPIFTAYVYALLHFCGVGLRQLNFISVIPGVLSVMMLALISRPALGGKLSLLASLLLSVNVFFLFNNRVAQVYSLLTFFCLLCVWLWQKGFQNRIFFYVSYVMICLIASYLKLLAILLLPILILFQLHGTKLLPVKKWRMKFWLSIGLFLIAGVLFGFKISPLVIGKWYSYALRGDSVASTLLKIPLSNWMYVYSKMLPEILLAYIYFPILFYRQTGRVSVGRKTELAVALFVVAANLAFFLFQYYPPRYYVFLIPFVCFLAASTVRELLEPSPPAVSWRRHWIVPFVISLWVFFLLVNLTCIFFSQQLDPHFFLMTLAVWVISLPLGFLLHFKVFLKHRFICRPVLIYLFLGAALLSHGVRYLSWAVEPLYSVKVAMQEAQKLIPENALVSGSYAHLLGFQSPCKKVWLFNLTNETKEPLAQEFARKNITHLALDVPISLSGLTEIHQDLLDHLLYEASFFILGYEIRLYRFSNEPWSQRDAEGLSAFERVAFYMKQRNYEKIREAVQDLPAEQQDLSQAMHWKSMAEMVVGDSELAVKTFQALVAENPYFAPAWYQLAVYHLKKKESDLANRAWTQALKAVQRTPSTVQVLSENWEQEKAHRSGL